MSLISCPDWPPLLSLDPHPQDIPSLALYADTSCCTSAWDFPLTWASPVSVQAYQYRFISPRGHPLTWASPVSNYSSSYYASIHLFLLPEAPTSLHICWIPVVYDPMRLPKYLSEYPLVEHPPLYAATTGPFSSPQPRNLSSPALRLWIWDGGPLTVSPLLGACWFMSVYPAYPPPLELSMPLYAARSHDVASSPISLSPAAKKHVDPRYPLLHGHWQDPCLHPNISTACNTAL